MNRAPPGTAAHPQGGIRPPPVYIALRFKPATLTALWGRGSGNLCLGVRSRSRVSPVHVPRPPVLAGARDRTIPTGLSRPTPERALPSQVGGAAEAASAPPRLRGGRRYR